MIDTNEAPRGRPQAGLSFTKNSSNNAITLQGTDADGDTLSFAIVTQPSNGTLTGTPPNVKYTPTANYVGTDSFTFQVNDGTADALYGSTVSLEVIDNTPTCPDGKPFITHNGTDYCTVTSPHGTGKVWLDRNLGATQVCTSATDTACDGDYYQWGRGYDGHEKSNSLTDATLATDINNAGSKFITNSTTPFDWASVGIDDNGNHRATNWSATDGSSICPLGYRVPTESELTAETSGVDVNSATTAYTNFLKLPTNSLRYHHNGSIPYVGTGRIWSSSTNGSFSRGMTFNSSRAYWFNDYRASGMAVRCIKALSPLKEVAEDLAGNANGTLVTTIQLNRIKGVNRASDGVDYSSALYDSLYANRANPTPAEIQAVIDGVNRVDLANPYGTASQGSTYSAGSSSYPAIQAIDKNDTTFSTTDGNNWWHVDMNAKTRITGIYVLGRNHTTPIPRRIVNVQVYISSLPFSGSLDLTKAYHVGTLTDVLTGQYFPITTEQYGQYVILVRDVGDNELIEFASVEVYGEVLHDLAFPAYTASTVNASHGADYGGLYPAYEAIDNDLSTMSHTSPSSATRNWWQIEFINTPIDVRGVMVLNRQDCCADRLDTSVIYVSDTACPVDANCSAVLANATAIGTLTGSKDPQYIMSNSPITGKYVIVKGRDIPLNGSYALHMQSIEIYGKYSANEAMLEVIEDIAGNANSIPVSSKQLNAIEGVSGALAIIDYSTALASGSYALRTQPTPSEIQRVIDSLRPFVTTWYAIDPSDTITIVGGGSNYTIDWGDGTQDVGVSADQSHNYANANLSTYTVSIFGDFTHFVANTVEQLETVEQWGSIKWTSMENSFKDTRHVTYNATDIPDLSRVTSMHAMFMGATEFNTPIGDWNISTITDLNSTFFGTAFNQPLTNWDTSSVTTMEKLFLVSSFNQNINDWNVSKVKNLAFTFSYCPFNQPLNKWDTSSVTKMERTFAGSTTFDQNINDWDVSSVIDMKLMFYLKGAYSYPLDRWDTSSVTDMGSTFNGVDASANGLDVSMWNVSNVSNFGGFDSASSGIIAPASFAP